MVTIRIDNLSLLVRPDVMRQSMKQMIVLQSVQQMIPYDVRETIQRESIERLSIEGVEEGSGRLFDHAPYPRRLP